MIALVTTTIQVPTALEWYRAIAPDVTIYVIGDEQTPHDDVGTFVRGLGNARYYSAEDQIALGYECSPLLGWRKVGRRSIGMLEAAKDGADVIVTVDDDNLPINVDYFRHLERTFAGRFSGLELTAPRGWVDPGWLIQPPTHHRGFPHELWHPFDAPVVRPTIGARVGVAAGLWLGEPDVDAVTRIATAPRATGVTELARAGVVLDRACYAPFNSQNTAVSRALLPAYVMFTECGRYDDIWAAYVTERVMREHDYVVHYGQPLVYQERNEHRLVRDLEAELGGMASTLELVDTLKKIDLAGDDVVEDARHLFEQLARGRFSALTGLGLAWVNDAERVLG